MKELPETGGRLDGVGVEVHVERHAPPLKVSSLLIETPAIVRVRLLVDGVEGEGYAWTLDEREGHRLCDLLLPLLRGLIAEEVSMEMIDPALAAALPLEIDQRRGRSMVESALLDANLKGQGSSLTHALGVRPRPMALYASDIYDSHTSSEIEAMAAGFVEAGFAGLKIRLGRPALRWAAERVRVARSAVGPGFPLMVDAVQGWDLDFCRRIESTLVGLDVKWLEDPFPAGDLSSYRRLAGNYGLPICTGESCRSLLALDAVIATGPEIVMLDVQHLGGIAATIQGIERAAAAGRRLTFHVFPDLGASLGAGTAVEWLEWAPLWGGHAGQPRLSNGRVSAGSEPGLGLWTS